MTEDFYTPERALVVVAHADDIEFGIGGTAARWTDNGAQVTFCITTDNGSGSNEPGSIRAELVKIREREQLAAAAILGVSDVRFLGYPDGTLQPTLGAAARPDAPDPRAAATGSGHHRPNHHHPARQLLHQPSRPSRLGRGHHVRDLPQRGPRVPSSPSCWTKATSRITWITSTSASRARRRWWWT